MGGKNEITSKGSTCSSGMFAEHISTRSDQNTAGVESAAGGNVYPALGQIYPRQGWTSSCIVVIIKLCSSHAGNSVDLLNASAIG